MRQRQENYVPSLWPNPFGIPGGSIDEGTYLGREQKIDYVARNIIRIDGQTSAVKIAKRIFQAPQEGLGVLPQDRLTVGLAGVT